MSDFLCFRESVIKTQIQHNYSTFKITVRNQIDTLLMLQNSKKNVHYVTKVTLRNSL